mmetsp:Transcript_77666/g.130350  ORF Transcript_77666/g.130350 Transcript_77666/m.130350 type:complete len:603 (-) Transcript_77666:22-1830(-)
MLRAHIHAPVQVHILERDLALLGLLLENVDRLRVRHAPKRLRDDPDQSLHKRAFEGALALLLRPLLFHPLMILAQVQNVGLALLQHVRDAIPQEVLGQIHEALLVDKPDFRLDHPELGKMSGGVGVFRPERWAKGVHVRQTSSVGFHVQLPGHCEHRLGPEKVLRIVGIGLAQERAHRETLPGALAVVGREDRGVHVLKVAVLEKLVDRKRGLVADAHDARHNVGPHAQVRVRPQHLQRKCRLGQRVAIAHRAQQLHASPLHLNQLPCCWALDHLPCHFNAGPITCSEFLELFQVRAVGGLQDNLEPGGSGAVIQLHKNHGTLVTSRPDPAGYNALLVFVWEHPFGGVIQQLFDAAQPGLVQEGAHGRLRGLGHLRHLLRFLLHRHLRSGRLLDLLRLRSGLRLLLLLLAGLRVGLGLGPQHCERLLVQLSLDLSWIGPLDVIGLRQPPQHRPEIVLVAVFLNRGLVLLKSLGHCSSNLLVHHRNAHPAVLFEGSVPRSDFRVSLEKRQRTLQLLRRGDLLILDVLAQQVPVRLRVGLGGDGVQELGCTELLVHFEEDPRQFRIFEGIRRAFLVQAELLQHILLVVICGHYPDSPPQCGIGE